MDWMRGNCSLFLYRCSTDCAGAGCSGDGSKRPLEEVKKMNNFYWVLSCIVASFILKVKELCEKYGKDFGETLTFCIDSLEVYKEDLTK